VKKILVYITVSYHCPFYLAK